MPLDDVHSILEEITSNAMEPDYRTHRPRRVAISTRHRIIAATGLVVVAFLVTSTIQIGVKNRARQTDVVKATKVGLIEQIQRADDRRGSLFVEVSAMSVAIDLLQRRNLQLSAQGVELAKKIDNALTYSGDRAVVGEGIVIRLDAKSEKNPVLDVDLQAITNGLWGAGAEAISISSIRLNALSAIRHAGDAVLVDYRPVTSPYEIAVVGDSLRIRAELKNGELGRLLVALKRDYGISASITPKRSVSIAGHSSASLRYASRVPA